MVDLRLSLVAALSTAKLSVCLGGRVSSSVAIHANSTWASRSNAASCSLDSWVGACWQRLTIDYDDWRSHLSLSLYCCDYQCGAATSSELECGVLAARTKGCLCRKDLQACCRCFWQLIRSLCPKGCTAWPLTTSRCCSAILPPDWRRQL